MANYSAYSDIVSATTLMLSDGHTVAWYDSQDLSTITKDANNHVTRWNNKLGISGSDLIIYGGTPHWSTDGILFDGVGDYLKSAAFTYAQPMNVYLVFKQVTWEMAQYIFDGVYEGGVGNYVCYQYSVTPRITMLAGGTPSMFTDDVAVDKWCIVRLLYNGTLSDHVINNGNPTYGSVQADLGMGGITLAARGSTPTGYGNIQIKEAIFRDIKDDPIDEVTIYNYLAGRWGFEKINDDIYINRFSYSTTNPYD